MESFTNIVKKIDSVLSVNQNIEITFDHPDFMVEYKSRVESILTDGIAVAPPTRRCIDVGTSCWVYFLTKGQRYGFSSRVRGYGKERVVLLLLARPQEILRLQRRKYFRVPVEIPVDFQVREETETSLLSGVIRNISSGGVLLIVSRDVVPVGKELRLRFTLSSEISLTEIPGKIVRVEEAKNGKKYEYGVEFIDVHNRLRDIIMRFVFNREIELNRLRRR
ncbi:MAG: hypothetical protein GXP58_06080 [Deltaproteobacteria bacterium]|nr:hypothetical protein [Deltaproteobacteria bacterium]